MNHLRIDSPGEYELPVYERISQSRGIRMHHLLGMDPSIVLFLTLKGKYFMHLANCYGGRWPAGCPATSLRQFQDMYVSRRQYQRDSDIGRPVNLTSRYL